MAKQRLGWWSNVSSPVRFDSPESQSEAQARRSPTCTDSGAGENARLSKHRPYAAAVEDCNVYCGAADNDNHAVSHCYSDLHAARQILMEVQIALADYDSRPPSLCATWRSRMRTMGRGPMCWRRQHPLCAPSGSKHCAPPPAPAAPAARMRPRAYSPARLGGQRI